MNQIKPKNLLLLLLLILAISCKEKTKQKQNMSSINNNLTEENLYRPNFHFTPNKSWMNDPNGMFYLNGTYHLYFQYYPDDNVWGPMHWGHAISKDMIKWEEQPIAIYPDELGYIFSGSAVVDINNTSGFGKNGEVPVVAMFTYHDPEGEKKEQIDFQSQAIAYSLDEGQTWTKYKGNPVIPNPGIKDFRDPKVIWDEEHNQWLMVLATYEKTLFYSSKNLIDWKKISEFGENIGEHGGVWECPDFFPLKVEGTNETKWVLLQSLNPGHINGGSGTQYFIGDFDGEKFTLDSTFSDDLNKQHAIWLDYGRDNYAGVTWSNVPKEDGRKLFIGWMSNWEYAQEVPTNKWRSSMTIARELELKKVDNSYLLYMNPVKEFNIYKKPIIQKSNIKFKGEYNLASQDKIDVNKSVVELSLSNMSDDDYKFKLENQTGDLLEFGINNSDNYFYIDRSKSGDMSFSEKFSNAISKAVYNNQLKDLSVQIIIDKTSLEIFYSNGQTVMTEIFFPRNPMESLSLESKSETFISNLHVSQLEFKK